MVRAVTPRKTLTQIRRALEHLAEVGLSDDQQFPFLRRRGLTEVTFENAGLVSLSMKADPYADIYAEFVRNRVAAVRAEASPAPRNTVEPCHGAGGGAGVGER